MINRMKGQTRNNGVASVAIPAPTVIPVKTGIQWTKSRLRRHIITWIPGQARNNGVASVVIPAPTVIPVKTGIQ